MGLFLWAVQGTLTPCVGGTFLIGSQWGNRKGSGHTGAIMGMARESIRCQGKSIRLAPLHRLVCPVPRSEVTFPPGTSVLPRLSSKQRRALSSITRSRPALGSRGLQAAMWTQEQTFKGTPAILGDRGPKFASLPFPEEGDDGGGDWGGGGAALSQTSTSANPMTVGFSNKINLLIRSVFCNFC